MKTRHILSLALFTFFAGAFLATRYARQHEITCTSVEMTDADFQETLAIAQSACLTQIAACEAQCGPTPPVTALR